MEEREAEWRFEKAELQLHTARSDHEMRALKAELSEANHVATLLESQVGKEVKVMAKTTATMMTGKEGPTQIHVRGVGGEFEAEAAIIGVFARFGPVAQATVRHRIDKVTGANTSWALVTMQSRDSAEAVLAAASSLPAPLTVAWFSKEQAKSSQGQMGVVRHEAAAKMI